MKHSFLFFIVVAALFASCKDEVLPKPKAMLRLDYPTAEYTQAGSDCVYTFDQNQLASAKAKENCAIELDYEFMKGSIYLTYKRVDGNLKKLLTDAIHFIFLVDKGLFNYIVRLYNMLIR